MKVILNKRKLLRLILLLGVSASMVLFAGERVFADKVSGGTDLGVTFVERKDPVKPPGPGGGGGGNPTNPILPQTGEATSMNVLLGSVLLGSSLALYGYMYLKRTKQSE